MSSNTSRILKPIQNFQTRELPNLSSSPDPLSLVEIQAFQTPLTISCTLLK